MSTPAHFYCNHYCIVLPLTREGCRRFRLRFCYFCFVRILHRPFWINQRTADRDCHMHYSLYIMTHTQLRYALCSHYCQVWRSIDSDKLDCNFCFSLQWKYFLWYDLWYWRKFSSKRLIVPYGSKSLGSLSDEQLSNSILFPGKHSFVLLDLVRLSTRIFFDCSQIIVLVHETTSIRLKFRFKIVRN